MRARSVAAGAAIARFVGIDELVLLIALACLTTGLWAVAGRAALIAPGLVLLWIALPTRTAFVASSTPKGKA